MRHRVNSAGYAMLTVLLMVALLGASVAVISAAFTSRSMVARDDLAMTTAQIVEADAWRQLRERWRMQPAPITGQANGVVDAGSSCSWQARWLPLPVSPAAAPQYDVTLLTRVPGATRGRAARVSLEPSLGLSGVVVTDDADIEAPLTLSGTGLYVGGSVRGRQNVTFASEAPGAADLVQTKRWPLAAVHAGLNIVADGVEIHEGGLPGANARDTDAHTGRDDAEVVRRLSVPPSRDLLLALKSAGATPVRDGEIDLGVQMVHTHAPAPCPGAIVAVDGRRDGPVQIFGRRAAAACPLVIVILGDAEITGRSTESVMGHGALIVTGDLRVTGGLRWFGHVAAGSLTVAGATLVEVSEDWRSRPLSGLVTPTITMIRSS